MRLLLDTHAHTLRLPELPFRTDHRDPFDRMLLVQAMREGLTLMTEDRTLHGHGFLSSGAGSGPRHTTALRAVASRNQSALSFGRRSPVAKSTWTSPKR